MEELFRSVCCRAYREVLQAGFEWMDERMNELMHA